MRRKRLSATSALIAIATILVPATARAECFLMTTQYVLSSPRIELLFRGRAVEITRTAPAGYRARFDVETVWKGTVPPRFDIYVWEGASEMPSFQKDTSYLVSAHRLTDPNTRKGVGLDGSETVVFTPTQCSGSFVPQIQTELGHGYPPEQPKF
jgi:hypothetical protein